MKEFLAGLNKYWFGWGDPLTLGLYRIVLGILILINQLLLVPYWDEFFSERGYLPNWLWQVWLGGNVDFFGANLPRVGLLNGVTDPRISYPFFLASIVLAILFILGLWTKATSILLAIAIVSIHQRSPLILHGGDTVIRVMIIYLAMSPCGHAVSLDRFIGRWRGKIPDAPALVPLWTQRLITYQISLVYFTTVWLKWGGTQWRDGTATYYPNRLQEFERFWVPPFMKEFPFVTVSTYATLLVEFAMVSLVYYRPLRKYVLLAAAGMHLFIDYSMNIPLFSYLMIASYLCFYESSEVHGWVDRMKARLAKFRISAFMAADAPAGPQEALKSADPFDLVQYSPTAPVAKPASVAARSPGSWILAIVPGLWPRLYRKGTQPSPPQDASISI